MKPEDPPRDGLATGYVGVDPAYDVHIILGQRPFFEDDAAREHGIAIPWVVAAPEPGGVDMRGDPDIPEWNPQLQRGVAERWIGFPLRRQVRGLTIWRVPNVLRGEGRVPYLRPNEDQMSEHAGR